MKFKVGDKCINGPDGVKCEIVAVGPWEIGEICPLITVNTSKMAVFGPGMDDYAALFEDDGLVWFVDEASLELVE